MKINPVSFLANSVYYLYILKCADGTLYTGITVDLARRVVEHNTSALGAKYTRGRRPVTLVFSKRFRSRSAASREESRIKKLSRKGKLNILHHVIARSNATKSPPRAGSRQRRDNLTIVRKP